MNSLSYLRLCQVAGRERHCAGEGWWGAPGHSAGLGDEPQLQAVPWECSSSSWVFCRRGSAGGRRGSQDCFCPDAGTHRRDVTQSCLPIIHTTSINSIIGLTQCHLDHSHPRWLELPDSRSKLVRKAGELES